MCTREVRRETMKEFRRSEKPGSETWSKSGASRGKRSVSSRERNSGEEKKAEELEKRPVADILVWVIRLTRFKVRLFWVQFSVLAHLQTQRGPTNHPTIRCKIQTEESLPGDILVWTEPTVKAEVSQGCHCEAGVAL